MVTLVVVAQHRNQYHTRVKSHGPAKFGTSPSRHFRDINCRTFQSGVGLLPAPFPTSITTTATKSTHPPPATYSPKSPSPAMKSHSSSLSFGNGCLKAAPKSSPITINVKVPRREASFNEDMHFVNESLPLLERWAGPAYSNSPPPSSLPIPKFSMRPPKRSVSLDLPVSDDVDINVQPTAKSAPASPTREYSPSMRDLFVSAHSATKTLRRILNLDIADE